MRASSLRLAALALVLLPSSLSFVRRAEADPIDVTIEGGPLMPRAEDPTVASSVVEGEALARPGTSITDALSSTPSVRVSRTGSGADLATIGLRGASNAETPVYLAGVKLNDELSGTADLSTVPLFFLRRISVYRGDAPFDLGTGGLGGAVLLEPSLPKSSRIGSGVGIGSFGDRSAWIASSVGTPKAAAAFAVRYDTSRNDYLYTDDRGTRFDATDDRDRRRRNADASVLDAWAVARARLGERGSVSLVTNVLSREQGLTGLGLLPALSARADARRALFAVEARARCESDPRDDGCEITASAYGKAASYLYRDPHLELPLGTLREAVSGESTGYKISLREQPVRWLGISAGVTQAFDLLGVDPLGGDAPRARRSTSRAFGKVDFTPIDRLTVTLAGAVASARTAGPDASTSALVPEARLGANVTPIPELDFFATLARYERLPMLGELYGTSASVLGNTKLAAEKGPGFEVGSRYRQNLGKHVRAAAEALFFYRSARQLIGYRRTSVGILRPYNVGSAHFLGSDIVLALEIGRLLRVDTALTLTDARDDSPGRSLSNDSLPFQAAVVDASGIHLRVPGIMPRWGLDAVGLGTTLVYRSTRFADSAGLVELPRQLSWDVDAAMELARGVVVARARLSNLLDDRSTDAVGYPLAGRAGHFSVEAWWP